MTSTVRGRLGRLAITTTTSSNPSAAFSTFGGGGGGGGGGGSGRGRGRGGGGGSFGVPPPSSPQIGASASSDPDVENHNIPSGFGHGRGKPIIPPSSPILPKFSSWVSGMNNNNNPTGRGRPIQSPPPLQPQQQQQYYQQEQRQPSNESQSDQPKKPIFFRREDSSDSTPRRPQFNDSSDSTPRRPQFNDSRRNREESALPSGVSSGLSGAGRGKTAKFIPNEERPQEENRHIRRGQQRGGSRRGGGGGRFDSQQRSPQSSPKLSRDEATKRAVGVLNRGGGGGGRRGGGGRFSGGRFRDGGRGGGGRGRGDTGDDDDDDFGSGLYLGEDADGEKFAKKIGLENMNQLVEGFEEMSSRVLPCPEEDAYFDALHTNNLIEYEPEYLMEEFGTNPDIDDKPPVPLRDALEKMKPFLMKYDGIKSQEEWEEIIEATMVKVPKMKELLESYGGPNRVTAMQQQGELERVAATVPERAPSSVKRSVNRAVLSLQSNPGWGWDKKCQFMDKLVFEVSQQYK